MGFIYALLGQFQSGNRCGLQIQSKAFHKFDAAILA